MKTGQAVEASSTSVRRLNTKAACIWAPVTAAVTGTLGSCLIDEKTFEQRSNDRR